MNTKPVDLLNVRYPYLFGRPLRALATTVLLVLLASGLAACDANSDDDEQDLVAVAVANDFDTLVAAVQAAGLVATLQGAGPYTVFAPTDEAFAALPPGALDRLLRPENRAELVQILSYHVVPGRVTAAQVASLDSAPTLQGAALDIRTEGGAVRVNEATVTATDIEASNGVVHVIDAVLLPPSGN